jgi:hypothetical protein
MGLSFGLLFVFGFSGCNIARRSYTGIDVHRIAVLIAMVLIDRVNAELASLKAERRDCRS